VVQEVLPVVQDQQVYKDNQEPQEITALAVVQEVEVILVLQVLRAVNIL
jgi:hypothetical protein